MTTALTLVLLICMLEIALAVLAWRLWWAPGLSAVQRGAVRVTIVLAGLATLPLAVAARWLLFPFGFPPRCDIEREIRRLEHPAVALARNGERLGMVDPRCGRYVHLDSLRPIIVKAFVMKEDPRFFDHQGVDLRGVLRAVYVNLFRGERQGASTIAMQASRVLCAAHMPRDHTWAGKLSETAAGLYLRDRYPASRILEWWINGVYVGRAGFGIDAAAETYFNVRAEELTLAEAAQIAALLPAPSRRDPTRLDDGTGRALRIHVLRLLVPRDSQISMFDRRVRLRREDPNDSSLRHFIARAAAAARRGDTIFATLDPGLQQAAESELLWLLRRVRASEGDPAIGMFFAIDAVDGDVLAYASRQSPGLSRTDWVRLAQILPSSTTKPPLFALAYDAAGLRLHDAIPEVAQGYCPSALADPWVNRLWQHRWGARTVEDAIAMSENYIAPCLLSLAGDGQLAQLQSLGLLPMHRDRPAAALGVVPVSAEVLLRTYAAIANGGLAVEPRFLLDEPTHVNGRIWSPEAAASTLQGLQQAVDGGTARTIRRHLDARYPAAGKTGTAESNNEFLFIGISGRIVALLWVGHQQPTSFGPSTNAGTVVAPAWARVMARYYTERAAKSFTTAGRHEIAVW